MFLELFDIYKIDARGQLFWIGATDTWEEAVKKIQTAHLTDIADLRTGMVRHIKGNEAFSAKQSKSDVLLTPGFETLARHRRVFQQSLQFQGPTRDGVLPRPPFQVFHGDERLAVFLADVVNRVA